MKRTIAIACMLAMISGGVRALHSRAQTPAPRKKHTLTKAKTSAKDKRPGMAMAPGKPIPAQPASAKPAQPVPAQIAPPIPATLMNRAPVSPNVTMNDGLLTIDAPNSMLSAVLSGVHNATGAVIEGATPDERVAVRLGPGNPRQVIAALLQGTPYDYFILGSQDRQDAVTRIVLTQPTVSSPAQNAAGAGTPPQPAWNNPQDRTLPDEEAAQPAGEIQADQAEPPQHSQPPQDQNQPKAPDQVFREMQSPDVSKP
jgi:hypothetical protein